VPSPAEARGDETPERRKLMADIAGALKRAADLLEVRASQAESFLILDFGDEVDEARADAQTLRDLAKDYERQPTIR
jgi:hypothetical protein